MGRGVVWDAVERQALSRAWSNATHNGTQGCQQKAGQYWETVYNIFKKLAPAENTKSGTYGDRDVSAVKSMWQNTLSPYVQKFVGVLVKVKAANLTGSLVENDFIKIAVAIHVKACPYPPPSHQVYYNYKNFDTNKWKNFQAYYFVLRYLAKFRAPNVPPVASISFAPTSPSREEEKNENSKEDEGHDEEGSLTISSTVDTLP